jgi:hypothetical protein
MLEEAQAGIIQTPKTTDYYNWDRSYSFGRIRQNTIGLDKWVGFKAGILGSCVNRAL